MTEIEKRQAALELLARTLMKPSSYQPLAVRLLWHLGVNVRPPHFASFLFNTVSIGGFYAASWGLAMWLIIWHDKLTPSQAATTAALAGLCFGGLMASYYAYGKRKHKLPSWNELGK
ncbi:DUF6404 family protein [Pseudoduganella sp. LjRoot289]|uniref:DUF6404 family protein n=1 Tax=Pseudoduganella sp. LjRoot289 TaxID=3342314 RepID=UPI003ECEAD24